MTTHKAIREALEAYQHMVNNGHTSGYAFSVAFSDCDPAGCIESLLADLDAKTEALKHAERALGNWIALHPENKDALDTIALGAIDTALKGTP